LRCRTLAQLLNTVAERIRNDFDASAATLAFITEGGDDMLTTLTPASVQTAFGEFHTKQRTWCGGLNGVQQRLLFPRHNAPIVSAAIVPLHLPQSSTFRQAYGQPLLVIGSVEISHFNASLDTLFLDFIGEVLAVHLQSFEP
jgi:uncharacterized protein YigA (DUF484 family)